MGTVLAVEGRDGVVIAGDSRDVDDGTVTSERVQRVFDLDGVGAGVVGEVSDIQEFRRQLDAELRSRRLEPGDAVDVDEVARIAARQARRASVDAVVASRDGDGRARIREIGSDGRVLSDTPVALGSGAAVALGRLEAMDLDAGVDEVASSVRDVVATAMERDTDTGGEVDVWTSSHDVGGSTTRASSRDAGGSRARACVRATPTLLFGRDERTTIVPTDSPAEDRPVSSDEKRVLILNPASGDGGSADAIRDRAAIRGYELRETETAGDAVAFAREATEAGASVVAAAGGDGTLNEVVRGVDRAGALDLVTVGVVPAGTGNNFAENVGITTIDDGFDVLDHGERRRIDLGGADGRVFVNSCVGGLTADASGETSTEMKSKFGVLAYVITTLRSAATFDGLRLTVDVREGGSRTSAWTGDAIVVLIGNGRRFTSRGSRQANMEDGLLDVTIIGDVPTRDLVGDAVVERLLGGKASNVTRLRAPALEVESLDPDPINFSLDGEMLRAESLSLDVRPGALRFAVGDGYEPDPE
jgi:YegS/Rv2252/BmrU family lipid kinase